MEILRRIDKGYRLIEQAKDKSERLMNIESIKKLKNELDIMGEEENHIRVQADEVRNRLVNKEKQLAEIEEKLLDLNSSDLNNIILQYCEIRPIISKDGCGMDYEDYPNSEEWLGCYVDVSGLGWFIKYIFNNGLANIAIIE